MSNSVISYEGLVRKLYQITCTGEKGHRKEIFVVGSDPTDAENKVMSFLTDNDIEYIDSIQNIRVLAQENVLSGSQNTLVI